MSDYTPTDADVRRVYMLAPVDLAGCHHKNTSPGYAADQFDRWLAAHDSELREQIARDIDRRVTDDDAWAKTSDDYREAGWDGDPDDYERMFWEAGQRRAARIARGGAS